jgi:hypothetical protein
VVHVIAGCVVSGPVTFDVSTNSLPGPSVAFALFAAVGFSIELRETTSDTYL